MIPFFHKQGIIRKIWFPLKPDDVIVMSSNVYEWKGKLRFIASYQCLIQQIIRNQVARKPGVRKVLKSSPVPLARVCRALLCWNITCISCTEGFRLPKIPACCVCACRGRVGSTCQENNKILAGTLFRQIWFLVLQLP